MSILARAAVSLIRLYKLVISPWLGDNCRFHPSCSAYCSETIARFGFFKGMYLGCKRILKCHPLHPGGVDLVPERYK